MLFHRPSNKATAGSQSHFPLSQLQMSPLVCLQWALCCLPVMACEISIIIIMAPRAAMSADGRSLIGNELSHHPKGTSFPLLFRTACLWLCNLTRLWSRYVSTCGKEEADSWQARVEMMSWYLSAIDMVKGVWAGLEELYNHTVQLKMTIVVALTNVHL